MGKRLDGECKARKSSPWVLRDVAQAAAAEDERELRDLLRAAVELVERRLRIVSSPVSPKYADLVALAADEDVWLRKAKAVLG